MTAPSPSPTEDHGSGPGPGPSELPLAGSLSAALLCGGASRRMGRDKALLEHEGEPLVARGARALAALSPEVVLACGAEPRYQDLGWPLALEGEADQGPLAGILAALEATRGERVLVAAVDLPDLARCPLAELAALAASHDLDLACLDDGRARPPLVWVVHRRCEPALREAFARGVRRLLDAFEGLSCGTVPVAPALARNWNTPADAAAFEQREGVA